MLHDELWSIWGQTFDGQPSCFASAPGRVNLIGEHTDYNEGYVFPAAIDRRTSCLVRLTEGPVRLISGREGTAQSFDSPNDTVRGWAKYPAGCMKLLEERVGSPIPRIEGAIHSTVPNGSGLSSSAALELCILAAWNHAAGLGLSNKELAHLAWRAEREYVGVNCGVMDQMASALGEEGRALFIDTRSLETSTWPIPGGVSIAVLDTRMPRSLAGSAYNKRFAECGRAVKAIQEIEPSVKFLRDVDLKLLDASKASGLDEVAYRRSRHVITENSRTLSFREALAADDRKAMGRLCRESHESLRDDYEVTSEELNAMARAAWTSPGCIAARMTGAGFGGCCVALVESAAYEDFERAVRASYGMYGFREPDTFETKATRGAEAGTIAGT